ncbi:MAG TPA: DNRLRE domain-containing protein [Polyangiaceae bacterium]
MPTRSRVAAVVSAALSSAASAGCMTHPRMCASESDCTAQASCVAGRCVAQGATAAIDTARRLVFFPVDVAYVGPGAGGRHDATVTLGRTGDEGAVLLLRFAAPLPPEATVLEAYLVLERPAAIDVDPAPIVLHAVRIVAPWDGRSVTWAGAPRTQEVGAPTTRVFPAAGPLVRLDVRPLVQRWRRRTGNDFGVAVEAEGASASAGTTTGVAVALAPSVGSDYDPVVGYLAAPAGAPHPFDGFDGRGGGGSEVARPGRDLVGPRLEVYVR